MIYLVDSNIFIYASNAASDDEKSYQLLAGLGFFYFASVTRIEVLGYQELDSEDKKIIESMFTKGKEIQLSKGVKEKAIELRQKRKMSLGDSIIAASALVHNAILVTRNVDDFSSIDSLQLFNPYAL
ncbi:MAG: type II toxin-antitoxin system VapC family toxin [Deltaproteobacteria bacterium]|nr:type II toxin-antitoxin system VapC family toxin [Candidatus Tharpella aukensis]